MSSIDERIVEMKFNNAQFEKGIKETSASLSGLKDSLKLDNATKSLQTLSDVGRNFSLNNIATGIDAIAGKFTALAAAGTIALGNIATTAINAGLSMVKSLTIAPIFQGYQDYNSKLTSIQTITNATGKSIQDVEKYFDQLDTYADKTIYNLSDMTGALAKFTNAGVSLDQAVPAIKGIANMTALAGQDSQAASIAFYNLSQSIAGGFLTTTDYRSLNLANVATKEWKQNLIDAAVAAGKVKKNNDGLYNIPGSDKAYTDAALFTEALSEQWATTDVLMKVLGDYGNEQTTIGKKALAAAQDVKSFGMMMETLKAGVGTGWTDSFQIIIGDLNESKKLWTGLTQTVGGFLDGIAEYRNKMLQVWKDLGGRTAAIDAVKNAWGAVLSVLNPIIEAFQSIFPPTTGKQLYDITVAIRDFTAGLTLGSTAMENLKRTFRGLFAVAGIIFEVIKAVGKAIFDLLGFSTKGGSGILAFTGNIGDMLYAFYEALKAGNGLTKFFQGLVNILKVPVAIIKALVGVLVGVATGLSSLDTGGVEAFSARMKAALEPLGQLGDFLSSVWDKTKQAFQKFIDFLAPVGRFIGDVLSGIGTAISDAFKNFNYDAALNTVNTGLFAGLVLLFKKFFSTGLKIDLTGGFLNTIKSVFSGLTDTLKAFQDSLKAKTLLTIASALLLLTISVVALSMIDSGKLASALAAITIMFTQLFGALAIFEKITATGSFKKLPLIAIALIQLSFAINLMSIAVARMAKLSWNDLAKGLSGVVVLLAAMIGVSKTISRDSTGLIKMGFAMIILGFGLQVLASAVTSLAKLSWLELAKGMSALVVALGVLVGFSWALKSQGPQLVKTGIALVILALGIKLLASAFVDMAAISFGSLLVGLGTMVFVLGTLIGISYGLNKEGPNLIKAGIALMVLAGGIKLMAMAVSGFAAMSWEELLKGIGSLAVILGLLIGFSWAVPKTMILTAAALVVISAGLLILANAMGILGKMSWEEVIKSLVMLAGSLAIIAGAMYLFSGAIAGAAAMIIVAGAMLMLAPALKMLGKMSWDEIGRGLTMLASALAILAVGGLLLLVAIPGFLGLGVAMLLIGAGALMAGAGLSAMAVGLTALAAAGTLGTVAMVAMATAMIGLIPLIAQKVGEGIVAIAGVIAGAGPTLIAALVTIISSLLTAIATVGPQIITTFFDLLMLLVKKLEENVPVFVDSGMKLINGILTGIANNIGNVITSATNVIVAFINGISQNLGRVIDAGVKLVISFINGVANALRNNRQALSDAGWDMAGAILDGMTGGLGSTMVMRAVNAVKGLGSAIIGAVKAVLGIRSPSKEFYKIGEWTGQGLSNGITSYSDVVAKDAENLGYSAVDGLKKSISGMSDVALANMDMVPTIRPVLDLSAIRKDSSLITGMLGTPNLSVDMAYAKASSISAQQQTIKADAAASEQVATGITGDTNISFVQNNTSPKALTAAEIYRQTKNQISSVKGVVALV